MIVLQYLKTFFTSLLSTKFGVRDFVLIAVIGVLLIRINSCSPKTSNTIANVPTLAPVQKEKAKDGTIQTVVKQTVFNPDQMKQVTKPIAKNLGLDKVSGYTQTVTTVDIDKKSVPATQTDSTITTDYKDKDISVHHVYNTKTKDADFSIHLSPDTVTYVSGVKTHWFKPDEYSVHINHTNSLYNDTLGMSYTYKDYKPWLVIGPSVGAGVDYKDSKFHVYPMVGVTATFPLITFKKKR